MVILQLLNDSEATVMRFTEQAKILKEEIRRMERNQKREEETSNMEYLKNILLKVSVFSVCNIYEDFYLSVICFHIVYCHFCSFNTTLTHIYYNIFIWPTLKSNKY